MPVPTAPPLPRFDLSLLLTRPAGDARTVDLATRALVVAVVPAPRWGREAEVVAGVVAAAEAGADLAEVPSDPRLLGPAAASGRLPVVARVAGADAARAASGAGATLVLAAPDGFAELSSQLTADTVAPGAAPAGGGAGSEGREPGPGDTGPLAPERIVPLVDTARAGRDAVAARGSGLVALDVTGLSGADAVSEESLALAVGVRLVRTADVRRTRRVVEVMARLLEARR